MKIMSALSRNNKFMAALMAIIIINTVAILLWHYPPLYSLAKYLRVEDEPVAADVIIVLAGSQEREKYAAELYKRGFSSKIILSGVCPASGPMVQTTIQKGVKREDILLDEKSASTFDNAYYSREIMLEHNYKSALVVSSPYHMRRSKLAFERVFKDDSMKLIYCPAPNTQFDLEVKNKSDVARKTIAAEYAKIAYYFFRYL